MPGGTDVQDARMQGGTEVRMHRCTAEAQYAQREAQDAQREAQDAQYQYQCNINARMHKMQGCTECTANAIGLQEAQSNVRDVQDAQLNVDCGLELGAGE